METSPAKPRLGVDSFEISNATYSATSAASGFPILHFGILWGGFVFSFRLRLRLALGLGFCQGGVFVSLCSPRRLLVGFPRPLCPDGAFGRIGLAGANATGEEVGSSELKYVISTQNPNIFVTNRGYQISKSFCH